MIKRILGVMALCVGGLLAQPAFADVVTVGTGTEYDYQTIQAAVNSGADHVALAAGNYTEAVTIPSGHTVVLSGNYGNNTAAVVNGRFTVEPNASLEVHSVTVNGSGQEAAYDVYGALSLKYGVVEHARHNVLLRRGATADIYEQRVQYAEHHGIVAKKDSTLTVNNSVLEYNGKAGVRAIAVTQLTVANSTVMKNMSGVVVKDTQKQDNTVLDGNKFESNKKAILLYDAGAQRMHNTFQYNHPYVVLVKGKLYK